MTAVAPEMIAAAWQAWQSRHGGKLGPACLSRGDRGRARCRRHPTAHFTCGMAAKRICKVGRFSAHGCYRSQLRRLSVSATLRRRYFRHGVSMRTRKIYDVRALLRATEVSAQSVSKLDRLSQALVEKPNDQSGGNHELSPRVRRHFALIAAADENLLKHLHVFAFQIGGVDFGRHAVLLPVGAKLTGLNRQRPFYGCRGSQPALYCGR